MRSARSPSLRPSLGLVARPLAAALLALAPGHGAVAWSNGQADNRLTDDPAECASPPYGTHDWIADRAVALLPEEQRAWIEPHRPMLFLGTEAPDNPQIPDACGAPRDGDADGGNGDTVLWNEDHTALVDDRAAVRAEEEYSKAVIAFEQGDRAAAAFFLGAMAHYIGEACQYGHVMEDEAVHEEYENWVSLQTQHFESERFDAFMELDGSPFSKFFTVQGRRRPFAAVKRISHAVSEGDGSILPASEMDAHWPERDPAWVEGTGAALNLCVTELARVFHRFWLNAVSEE